MKGVYEHRYEEDAYHDTIQQFRFIKLQLKIETDKTKMHNRYAHSFIYTYFIVINSNNDI